MIFAILTEQAITAKSKIEIADLIYGQTVKQRRMSEEVKSEVNGND